MEWKEVRLGDYIKTNETQYSIKENWENFVYLDTGSIIEGRIDTLLYFTKEDKLPSRARRKVQHGDIIYSCVRPNQRHYGYINIPVENLLVSTGFVVISCKDIDSKYLYYYLTQDTIINYLQNIGEQSVSTYPTIKPQDIEDIFIRIPSDIEDQRRIASILSSLDRKIELNNKINADLEEMAQAIFKNWFVDFEPFKDGKFVDSELGMIPEGWKVGTLDEIADITMGQSPAGYSLNEKGEGMIFYQGSSDFGFRFPSIRVFTTEPKRLAVVNSVLFSVRAPVGDINVTKEECCIGRGVASIKSKYGHDSYLFYTMKSLHKLFDSFDGEGTVFGSINKKTLSAIQILLPSDGIVEQFNDIASSFDNRIRSLSDENSRLSLLRDTLLPRLMSGELEVPE